MKLSGSSLFNRVEIMSLMSRQLYFLKFPKQLEVQYSSQYKKEAAREFQIRGLIIFLLYLYLSIGIYKIIPAADVKRWFMLYSWVGIIIIGAWILSLIKQIHRWFELYTGIGSSLAIGISFAMTGILGDGGSVLYHAAMMYAVVIIYGFVGMRFYTATLAGWSGGLVGLTITSFFNGHIDWTILQRTYTFSSLLGMCLAYATDLQHRDNYLQGSLIELTQLELINHSKQFEKLSQRDALTGLANRRYLKDTMAKEWKRAIRYQTPLTVILIDIDYFKKYNDTLGHQAGDRCIKIVADCIAQSAVRSSDLAARYGGEEFLLLLAAINHEDALKQAERLIQLVRELKIPHPASLVAQHITISMGVASTTPKIHEQYDNLIKKADDALYEAKTSGRNC